MQFKRLLMMTLVLLCRGIFTEQGAPEMAEAVVPICCPLGHILSLGVRHWDTLLPADVLALCTRVSDRFYPIYFNPFKPGYIPSRWMLEYSRVPECAKLRVIGMTVGMLQSKGELIFKPTDSPLASNRYCINGNVLLVCLPDVFKCCPPGTRVEGEWCVQSSFMHDIDNNYWNVSIPLHRLINSNDGTAGVGQPTCEEGCQLGMVGDLDKASYETDGVLQIGSARLERGKWCAGWFKNSKDASVFACVPGDSSRKMEEDTDDDFSDKLLEADKRDSGPALCKIMEREKKAMTFGKAWENKAVPRHYGVVTEQECAQKAPWIMRNTWVIGLVCGLLCGLLFSCLRSCRRKDKSPPQIPRTSSNQNEYV